jgi:hypothetical protein
MSLYQKASLVQIPSGYKASADKLYSVVPSNGDGDFTVDSSPLATRVNKDGLIESVVADQARLNYDFTNPQDPHLLLEPARTNRVFPNNSLTGYSTIGVTTSNNQTTAPNGANEGAKVQATTSGTAVVFKGFTGTSGVTHNISAFVKAGTHNQVRLQEGFSSSRIDVNLSTGTEVSSQNATNKKIEAYPNDWYRISFNFTSSSANLQFALYFNGSYTSGENVYLYGGQIEEGTYATSLIPTSGGILTRTEDNIYGAGDANLFNDTEGTLFVDVEPFTYEAVARITLSDSSTSDRIVIGTANSTQFRLLVIQGGAAPFRMDTFRNITYNTRNKIAITYKQNEYKLAINGTVVLTTTNTGLTPQGLNQLRFSDGDSGFKFRGKVFQTMVFNEALSNTELQELTSL